MARFRCKLSGNIFTFENDFDVLEMREHPQYEEIEEEEEIVVPKKTTVASKKTKKEAK